MTPSTWVYDDGGREAAGFRGSAGDCVTRAIAIASELPYREVYDRLFDGARERRSPRGRRNESPRNGVRPAIYKPYLAELGFAWQPTMHIGQGCRVHLRADELPGGVLIARVTRHLSAVVDGVIHDTHDPSRDGTRCVYGYWMRGAISTPHGKCLFDDPAIPVSMREKATSGLEPLFASFLAYAGGFRAVR